MRVGLTAGRLRIDERILHYLAGVNYLDPRLQPLLQAVAPPAAMAPAQRQVCESVLAAVRAAPKPPPIIRLQGDDEDGQSDVAAEAAAQLGLQLQRLYAEDLPTNSAELDALATLWQREAALLGAALLVQSRDGTVPAAAMNFAERIGALLFLAGREAPSLKRASVRFVVNKPRAEEQKELWQEALGAAGARLNGALDSVAAQFCLSAHVSTPPAARYVQRWLAASDNDLLWRACRDISRARLDDLAQRIEPAASWDDLILPEAQKNILRQIAAHVRQPADGLRALGIRRQRRARPRHQRAVCRRERHRQDHGGGSARQRAAARSLPHRSRRGGQQIHRRDRKESAPRVRRRRGQRRDPAFRRSRRAVRQAQRSADSHDRYANIEVSYLLQRMEAYRGLAILTTNMKSRARRRLSAAPALRRAFSVSRSRSSAS